MVNLSPCGLVPSIFLRYFKKHTYKLQNLEDSEVFGGPVNGHFLKNYFS
jgi:hypothetical protein